MKLWLSTAVIVLLTTFVFAQKQMSDSEVDKLKDKVKSVAVYSVWYHAETYDEPFTLSVDDKLPEKKRLPQETVFYDEKGNRVRVEYFNASETAYKVDEYGFLAGKRVVKEILKSKPPRMPRVYQEPIPGVDDRKRDERFTRRFEYKYDDKGRRVEERWFDNRDLPVQTIARNYDAKGNLIEQIERYINNSIRDPARRESPPARYLYSYDARGNETKKSWFPIIDINKNGYTYDGKKPALVTTYSHYEFDSRGNWTKRIGEIRQTNWFSMYDGATVIEDKIRSILVEYRTISYF